MRKALSIFFLVLFLTYHVGYLGYYWYASEQIQKEWQSRSFVEGHVKKVSIPITLPYWNDQSDYRPADGKVVLDGKIYRKVMQKYAQDALHLILVEDTLTAELNKSIADWVQAMTDPENDQSNSTTLIKSLAKDYLQTPTDLLPEPAFVQLELQYFLYHNNLSSISLSPPTPPPWV